MLIARLLHAVVRQAAQESSQPQKTLDRNILVDRFPVNTDTVPNKAPFISLLWRSHQQAWRPSQRDRHLAPVSQHNVQSIIGAAYLYRQRLHLNCQSAHAISPPAKPDFPRLISKSPTILRYEISAT
jgi:hypothetical protein